MCQLPPGMPVEKHLVCQLLHMQGLCSCSISNVLDKDRLLSSCAIATHASFSLVAPYQRMLPLAIATHAYGHLLSSCAIATHASFSISLLRGPAARPAIEQLFPLCSSCSLYAAGPVSCIGFRSQRLCSTQRLEEHLLSSSCSLYAAAPA